MKFATCFASGPTYPWVYTSSASAFRDLTDRYLEKRTAAQGRYAEFCIANPMRTSKLCGVTWGLHREAGEELRIVFRPAAQSVVRYIQANLEMKEKAVARLETPEITMKRYHPPDKLLAFLQSL